MGPTKAAYVAGVLDSRGYFYNHPKSPRIEVESTNEPVIRALHEVAGGYILKPKQRRGTRPRYRWRISGRAARFLARAVMNQMRVEGRANSAKEMALPRYVRNPK